MTPDRPAFAGLLLDKFDLRFTFGILGVIGFALYLSNKVGHLGSIPSTSITRCSVEVTHSVWDRKHVGSNPTIWTVPVWACPAAHVSVAQSGRATSL